jgi:hypothetical protein
MTVSCTELLLPASLPLIWNIAGVTSQGTLHSKFLPNNIKQQGSPPFLQTKVREIKPFVLEKTQHIYSQQRRSLDSVCDLSRMLPQVAPNPPSTNIHSLLPHGPGTEECHVHCKKQSATFPQTARSVLPFRNSGQTLCIMISTSVQHWRSNSMKYNCNMMMSWKPRCNGGCKYQAHVSSTRDSEISRTNGTNGRVAMVTVHRNRLLSASCSSVLFWTSVTHPGMTMYYWQYRPDYLLPEPPNTVYS